MSISYTLPGSDQILVVMDPAMVPANATVLTRPGPVASEQAPPAPRPSWAPDIDALSRNALVP